MFPSSMLTFISLTHAPSTPLSVLVARATASLIASSKLVSDMALNSVTRATLIFTCLPKPSLAAYLRASADRLRSAARSSLPAVATPSFSNESPYDDDHLGEGHPEVDDSIPTLGTPHQLLMGVVPRVRALHYPTFRRLKRRWLTFLGDCGEQATVL